ncbi:helix-turn-helix domain-containing protein [Mucilaginibacter sp. KACC 22773]|uniref:winged helix-turn-helix transcriptional regulator n=1 Tax=Mucilaginibacter sp. KACC 22773 TaxID=3025671 RepID=UPI002365ADDA|nr:helix-turn-helix domain-containing protein [Mucilaginibacter sp. KACC 22773]WDF77234.1 helix-turn-helix domain-containing protein [Mucilaginibacter sp. KACC 22773]
MENKTNGIPGYVADLEDVNIFEKCPFNYAMQLIGGKWKPVVLYCIKRGANRFGMLQRAMPAISKQMLTTQLRELETAGLIIRKVYAEVPPKVEYSISKNGETVFPVLEAIEKWGQIQRDN